MDKTSAAVVIIGGGVVGASVAYHLAGRGLTDVLVIERGALGSGSTGRSAGGVRQQFSGEANCRLSMLSVEKLLRFREEIGWDPGFHQVGYLFILTREDHWELFQRSAKLQRNLGIPVALITPGEAQAMVAPLLVDDVLGATYCPTDGHADPTEVCLGYAAAARARGVEIASGVTVTGIEVANGHAAAVDTDQGRVTTPLVVDAAGPWAAQVAAMAGVDIPLRPYRRQIYYTTAFPQVPDGAPMVVDFASSLYFRREGPGLLVGMTDRSEPSSFRTHTDDAFLEMLIEHAVRRVPALDAVGMVRGWAGLYDQTPDANPILGSVPELEGFIIAAGFSGHGFMHSPATGQLIAELIVDGVAHAIDISPFALERFRAGGGFTEQNVI
jgi:sarcosine oxidase subunit beta